MSIALGDINKESLTALVAQGGTELDEFVDRIQKALAAAETQEEAVLDAVETKIVSDLSEIVNNVEAVLKDLLVPVNAAVPQVVAMLSQITGRGLVITIALAPNESQPKGGN